MSCHHKRDREVPLPRYVECEYFSDLDNIDGEDYAKFETYRSVYPSSNAHEYSSHLLKYYLSRYSSFNPVRSKI
jgi:hypothetical protein